MCRLTYALPVRISTSSESFEIVAVFVDVNVPVSVPLAPAPAVLNGTMTLAFAPMPAGPWMCAPVSGPVIPEKLIVKVYVPALLTIVAVPVAGYVLGRILAGAVQRGAERRRGR